MPGRIFISYSHEDEMWKDRVVKQLKVLAPNGLEVWDDRRIAGGDDWQAEIEQAMTTCDAAVLLISADFLTSQFILGKEVPALLQRRESEGVRVIPLIVWDCEWRELAWLSPINALPRDGKALADMRKAQAEKALSNLAGEIEDLLKAQPPSPATQPGQTTAPRIQLDSGTHRFPAGAPNFLGRDQELAFLDQAWATGSNAAIVQIIAPGGTGKTALLRRWLDAQRDAHWGGASQVFGWSFYSQGTREDSQASEGPFLEAALKAFGAGNVAPNAHAHDKGVAIAQAMMARRSLLVLDGLEPLQYPPGPQAGELRAPGVRALLEVLALGTHSSLCLISSREHVTELQEWVKADGNGRARVLDLNSLPPADGALLLYRSGAKRVGDRPIVEAEACTTPELLEASQAVKGHALTLSLLGGYLGLAYEGDIRQWQQVDFADANAELKDGHAFRVMAAYEHWFDQGGDKGERYLAALRFLGFFDRPASKSVLRELRQAPAIQGLTRPLVNLKPELWQATLKHLQDLRLLTFDPSNGSVDAHPLLREYFAHALRTRQPDAWREGHRRIYEHLKNTTKPHRPDGLDGLQPLYQAVRHGCQAGLYEEALGGVYIDRILRGTDVSAGGFYSTKRLGAFGDNQGAVACFFSRGWKEVVPSLPAGTQAWLLNEAAVNLRALGRLEEALEPTQSSSDIQVQQHNWENAASAYGNMSSLHLTLGHVAEAVGCGALSVQHADTSQVAFRRLSLRTTHAYALLQQAANNQVQNERAMRLFEEAEAFQKEFQPHSPLLYSLGGFRYCEVLLAPVEEALWQGCGESSLVEVCIAVMIRAQFAQKVAQKNHWTLDIALDHLTLARCTLYRDLLERQAPSEIARWHAKQAVDGLRQSGQQDDLPRGLLTRAWLYFAAGETEAAKADLDEAQRIAQSGQMRLYLADIALMRAKFLQDKAALETARRLIHECGYGRRIPFLQALERSDQPE